MAKRPTSEQQELFPKDPPEWKLSEGTRRLGKRELAKVRKTREDAGGFVPQIAQETVKKEG